MVNKDFKGVVLANVQGIQVSKFVGFDLRARDEVLLLYDVAFWIFVANNEM